jgi:hypothetical protein
VECKTLNALANHNGAPGRLVSGLERVWLAADRVRAPFAIGWAVHGTGTLDASAWQTAVAAVARAWPGTTARAQGAGRRLRWVPTGVPPPVMLDPDLEVGARRLDPAAGVVAALILVPANASAGAQLVFWGHHAVFDARALAAWAQAVAAAARGEAVPAEGQPPALAALGAAPRTVEPVPDQRAVLGQPGSERGTLWGWRRVSGATGSPTVPVLRALAKLAAADHGAEAIRVGVPVDLRARAEGLAWGAYNLTGVAHLVVSAAAEAASVGDDVRALAAGPLPLAHARGAEGLAGMPLCLMGWVGRRSVRRRLSTGRFATAAVVSNVGRADLRTLDGAGFVAHFAVWAPPRNPGVPLFVMLGGDAGGVSISAAMPRALASAGRLDRVLDGLAGALKPG